MALAANDYEQAGELKIGQVGIANLRIRTLDVDQLVREMRERVERAPKLFGRAAVIVDFGGLRSFHPQVKEKTGHKALKDIKLMKEDAAGVEKQSEEIKKRYTQLFKV